MQSTSGDAALRARSLHMCALPGLGRYTLQTTTRALPILVRVTRMGPVGRLSTTNGSCAQAQQHLVGAAGHRSVPGLARPLQRPQHQLHEGADRLCPSVRWRACSTLQLPQCLSKCVYAVVSGTQAGVSKSFVLQFAIANCTQVVPSTAIGFTLYDSAKQFLGLKGNI